MDSGWVIRELINNILRGVYSYNRGLNYVKSLIIFFNLLKVPKKDGSYEYLNIYYRQPIMLELYLFQ